MKIEITKDVFEDSDNETVLEVSLRCIFETSKRGFDDNDHFIETDQSDIYYSKKGYTSDEIKEIDKYISEHEEELKNELNDKYLNN